ncbi:hypothetical protein BURMUCF1_A1760 [Burkholderia multivorans ATCC BAA-247]|uniref:Uncharacterized protein n=1 Tax=Burkholderia multivorans CGD2 TaxID=513052 RepID=B9BL38_9BURK|nr:hypothetical protein BURMUCGD2_5796 [Burkholderia multivorans CGD2]EEE16340.1 hypothetical protein BURMUCGD2M_5785 [Burkholderia multivorans CGD2M]EJO53351.1 hypothetical protein BURMUCF1_A1760 [Burkholderia multivorans ATCC BAA-247]
MAARHDEIGGLNAPRAAFAAPTDMLKYRRRPDADASATSFGRGRPVAPFTSNRSQS